MEVKLIISPESLQCTYHFKRLKRANECCCTLIIIIMYLYLSGLIVVYGKTI